MSKFQLRPFEIKGKRLQPKAGVETLALTFKEMCARFAPSDTREARAKIVLLKAGNYFGLLKDEAGVTRNFIINIPSRDTKVDWLFRDYPLVAAHILEIYEVEQVLLDAKLIDVQSSDSL